MDTLINLDKELFLAMNFDGGAFLDKFFWIVSGKLTWLPLYALIILLLYRRYGLRNTVIAVLIIAAAVGVTDQVCNFFKNFVPKPRPSHNPEFEGLIHTVNNYKGFIHGTVSAHAATTFSVMTISSSLIRARWFTITVIIWTLLVCYSRIYIGAHYPLDLIFGGILGVLVGVLGVRSFRWVVKRYRKKDTSNPQQAG